MPRSRNLSLDPFPWEFMDEGGYCHHPGCRRRARFPAPRRCEGNEGKRAFCLEHARLHNESWNYFADMSPEEIEYHRRQDTVGWRPSWPLGERGASLIRDLDWHGDDPLFGPSLFGRHQDKQESMKGDRPEPENNPDIRRACAILGVSPPLCLVSLKNRYKILARRFHPDAHGGDSRYSAHFRQVKEAYEQLRLFVEGGQTRNRATPGTTKTTHHR